MTIDQFISRSQQVETEQQLFNLLIDEIGHYGFDTAMFNLHTDHYALGLPAKNMALKHTNSVDALWQENFCASKYDDLDPFRSHCFYGQGVLSLEDMRTTMSLTAAQIKFLQATEAAGFHNRLTVALRGGSGAVAGLDIGVSTKLRPLDRSTFHMIHVLGQHFYQRYWQLKKSEVEQPWLTLTGKEREVLEWSAKGFTKAEIGARLHISSHTVDYHSRKLARKLGARNITAAAVTALNRGLIHV